MKMLETVYLLSVSLLSQLLLTRPRPSKLARRCLGCKVFIVISHLISKQAPHCSLRPQLEAACTDWYIEPSDFRSKAEGFQQGVFTSSARPLLANIQNMQYASMHRCMYDFQSLEGSRRVVAQVHGRQKKGWRQSNWRIQGIHRFDACVLIVIHEKTADASCCCCWWWWWCLLFF